MQMTARAHCLRDPCRDTFAHTLMDTSPVLSFSQLKDPILVSQMFTLHMYTSRSNKAQHMDNYCSYVELSPKICQSRDLNPWEVLKSLGTEKESKVKISIPSLGLNMGEDDPDAFLRQQNPFEHARLTAPDQKVLQLPLPREALPGDSRQPTAC